MASLKGQRFIPWLRPMHSPSKTPATHSYPAIFSSFACHPNLFILNIPSHYQSIVPCLCIRDLLILSKPLRLSFCTSLILNLSLSFRNTVSMPYIRAGTKSVSCKTLVHSSCISLTLTRDLRHLQPSSHSPPSYYTLPHMYPSRPKHIPNI